MGISKRKIINISKIIIFKTYDIKIKIMVFYVEDEIILV